MKPQEQKKDPSWSGALRAAFPYTIPVLTGYLFLGAAFGILLQSKGFSVKWAMFMSLTMYAGSGQFVAVNLLSYGADIFSVIFMTLMVNIRHMFYGLSMLQRFQKMGRFKSYMIFSLTDETFSLLCSVKTPNEVDEKKFLFLIASLNQSYWVAGSVLGSLLGTLLSFDGGGVDFVMTALFITIFIDQWKQTKDHLPALTGLGISLLCLLIWGPESFILPAMIGMAGALILMRRKGAKA